MGAAFGPGRALCRRHAGADCFVCRLPARRSGLSGIGESRRGPGVLGTQVRRRFAAATPVRHRAQRPLGRARARTLRCRPRARAAPARARARTGLCQPEWAAVAPGRACNRDGRVPVPRDRQPRGGACDPVRQPLAALCAHVRAAHATAVFAHPGPGARHVREPRRERQGRAIAIDPARTMVREQPRHRILHAESVARCAGSLRRPARAAAA